MERIPHIIKMRNHNIDYLDSLYNKYHLRRLKIDLKHSHISLVGHCSDYSNQLRLDSPCMLGYQDYSTMLICNFNSKYYLLGRVCILNYNRKKLGFQISCKSNNWSYLDKGCMLPIYYPNILCYRNYNMPSQAHHMYSHYNMLNIVLQRVQLDLIYTSYNPLGNLNILKS